VHSLWLWLGPVIPRVALEVGAESTSTSAPAPTSFTSVTWLLRPRGLPDE